MPGQVKGQTRIGRNKQILKIALLSFVEIEYNFGFLTSKSNNVQQKMDDMQIFKNRSNLLIVLQCGQLLYGVLVSPHIHCFQISCERWQILFFRRILDKKICPSFKTNCTLPIEVAGQGFF